MKQKWDLPRYRAACGRGFLLLLAALLATGVARARGFRVAQLPNGNVYSCSTCHFSTSGGGPRNSFGLAVQSITGTSPVPFWSPSLAALDSDGDGFTNGEELGDPNGDFSLIPGAEITRPGDPASFPAVLPPILDGASLEIVGLAIRTGWTGGRGPYIVQHRAGLNDASWINLMTTTNTNIATLLSGSTGFLRVGSRASTTVIPLTAWITGENQIPTVASPGLGLATLSIEDDTLSFLIDYSGLQAEAQAAQIHGPATSSENANLLHLLAGPAGTTGALQGTVTLSAADKDLLLSGRTYVNIVTSTHESGEIRGQIAPTLWQAHLTGGAEVPPVTTPASGSATLELVGNQLFWQLSYSNLTGPALAAHLHGPADSSENASPLVTFPVPATATGSAEGSTTLDAIALRAFIDGMTYINVHTAQHDTGEIRGQVQPAP